MSEHCDEALANIYMYLDRELDADSTTRIRAHLVDCPPCGDMFDFEERLKVVVRTRLQEEVPPVLIDRLRSVIRGERFPGV